MKASLKLGRRGRLPITLAVLMAFSTMASVAVTESGTTGVELSPSDATVEMDETTIVEVVVPNADGGIGAYDVEVALTNGSVGKITNVQLGGRMTVKTATIRMIATMETTAMTSRATATTRTTTVNE